MLELYFYGLVVVTWVNLKTLCSYYSNDLQVGIGDIIWYFKSYLKCKMNMTAFGLTVIELAVNVQRYGI